MHTLLGVTKLNVDPETQNGLDTMVMIIYIVLTLTILGLVAWHALPEYISRKREKREKLSNFRQTIWFDEVDSILHKGNHRIRIELRSIEYYVCKHVLMNPDEYLSDSDVFDLRDRSKEAKRAVEQAVNRLNKKCRATFGLGANLFIRAKEGTSVNGEYRGNIRKQK